MVINESRWSNADKSLFGTDLHQPPSPSGSQQPVTGPSPLGPDGDSGFSSRLLVAKTAAALSPVQCARQQRQRQHGLQHRHHGEPPQGGRDLHHHPRHPLRAGADLRGSGLDPGGLHPGGAGEPSGLGHVRVRLLLRDDLHLDGGVRLWGALQQEQLGSSRLYLSRHRRLLLPQRFSGFGQSDSGHEGWDQLPELPAGHLRSGLLIRGDSPLLRPHHPLRHPMEIFLDVSLPWSPRTRPS